MFGFQEARAPDPRPRRCRAATPRWRCRRSTTSTATPLTPPYPEGTETMVVGMGCFWGAERAFWSLPGVWVTAVGYAGGITPNPTYEEMCSGRTGHTEAVLVVFDPALISYEALLKVFWENHDPTQGMRQGNDVGTQYRSAIYTTGPAQQRERRAFGGGLRRAVWRRPATAPITTEIAESTDVLLRRGLPPAVPGQEPERLLRPRAAPACPARSAWPPPTSPDRGRSG